MFCIQCGTENPEGSKYCVSCSAVMPLAAPTGNPAASNLDIEEMVEYPIPETHYQSPVLQQLAWTVHEFMEEEGELEPVVEAYEAFREIFDGFKQEIPKLKELCYNQQGVLDDDVMPSQIKYMVTQAETLFQEGEALFEKYLDSLEELGEEDDFPDPQPLVEGTKKWLACNDSVCITFDFLVGRQRAFDELIVDLDEIQKEQEYEAKHGKKESPEPAAEEEPAAPPLVPSDSTDLA